MQRLTGLINQFSFSRKLAFTFFICSLLTFVVIDIIMNVLYTTVVTTNAGSKFDTQAFCQFSNSEIISSAESYINSGVDIYEEIVTEVFATYKHFNTAPQLYTSKQKKNVNPPLASTFASPRYDRSCMYFFTPSSTFYNQPYLDKIIASSSTSHYPSRLKRLNIIYQSKSNPSDISVRTMPATNDFYIPDAGVITARMQGLREGIIEATGIYQDVFSLADNQTRLIALRLLVPEFQGAYMLIEAEIISDILTLALTNIISFPSTKVALIKVKNGTGYEVLAKSPYLSSSIDLSQYLSDGSKNSTIEGSQFLITTRKFIDNNNDINVNPSSNASSPEITDNLIILFLNKSQAQVPNNVYNLFLDREYEILVYILYGWTFIVLLIIFAIGFVVGDIIFSYFSMIRKKSKQYLHNPQELKQIDAEMKERFKNQSKNRYLSDNIVGIMQGIQSKKKENRKNYKICYDLYPLNRLGMSFQNRMRIRDYHRLEDIAAVIKQRQAYLK